jgi:hypothetical protein
MNKLVHYEVDDPTYNENADLFLQVGYLMLSEASCVAEHMKEANIKSALRKKSKCYY